MVKKKICSNKKQIEERIKMIEAKNKLLSIKQQCKLLEINRSIVYYKSSPKKLNYDVVKKNIVEIWKELPSRGCRYIVSELKKRDCSISKKKVSGLMKELKISALFPKRNLSKANRGDQKYPYLLKNVELTHPNQVWSTDITYFKIKTGVLYLTAIIDWYSRKILSWRVSNSLDKSFCIDALKVAIKKYGKPEIFNSDQGVQYTSKDFTDILKQQQIQISMDGKGRALDNIYIERFWRTIKYEYLNLWYFENVSEFKESVKWFVNKYNSDRGHQSLQDRTPDQVYFSCDFLPCVA